MEQQVLDYEVDEYSIPTVQAVTRLPFAPRTEHYEPLEKVIRRLLSFTEKSSSESMASEHASYGSTRFYLKTMLPTNGFNHVKSIGDEAAAAVIFVDPETKQSVVNVYSSESHNGPSYVCPPPGAGTGAGGDERDRAAQTASKPDLQSEARRQCDPRRNQHGDPVARHTTETTLGISEYTNAMGIAHHTGSLKFHAFNAGNNLVNVMGTSVVYKEQLMHNQVPISDAPEDYVAIYIGKASDTTGIGGTKFASVAIDMTQIDLNEKAVQDPDPHLQENEMRGLELLVDIATKEGWKDKIALKDMGAAGLLCSTLEQLHSGIGVVINGDLVPQNAPRSAVELLEAETQERFFIYVHKDYAQRVLDIFNEAIGLPYINKGARAAIIGRCNNTGQYTFVRNGIIEVDLPVEDFKQGPLLFKKVAEPLQVVRSEPHLQITFTEAINAVLASPNFKNDAYVHSHYDKNVRSLPIVRRGQGPAPLHTTPLLKNQVAISTSFDSNIPYGLIDPALQAEDSFLRGAYNMALVGCSVIGVTNNANYGRTNEPTEMWQFKEGQAGVARACRNWLLETEYVEMVSKDEEVAAKMQSDDRRHLTVNSGNCSLNKANANTGTAIPPTTILGLQGWTNTPHNYATWNMHEEYSILYLVGDRQAALGGTDLLQEIDGPDCKRGNLFKINYATARNEVAGIIAAVRSGLVAAANNIEEGGLANAVGELFANTEEDVSVHVNLEAKMGDNNLSYVHKLCSESYGAVLQVRAKDKDKFEALMKVHNVTPYRIGMTKIDPEAKLTFSADRETKEYVKSEIKELYDTKLERILAA